MKIQISPEALAEAEASRDYYGRERDGLGNEFVDEVHKVLTKIKTAPHRFPFVKDSQMQRALLKRFPFMVLFEQRGDIVRVLVIAHQHRSPDSFLRRI